MIVYLFCSHHSTSDNNNKEVENIFNQVNDHQGWYNNRKYEQ